MRQNAHAPRLLQKILLLVKVTIFITYVGSHIKSHSYEEGKRLKKLQGINQGEYSACGLYSCSSAGTPRH